MIRLATYGSLGPGRLNHNQLASLAGHWTKGVVRGTLVQAGWGAGLGYPGLILDARGGAVAVDLFASPDLTAHWPRLDAFEGDGYRRVLTGVETCEGMTDAWIYVLVQPAEFRP
ncbi:gamma-glutamylcyclotransferase [Methylobacterium sp. E-046]|uniref:gamma-glutamylcyclotransferase family protein n=1 Tax=Methylobacterium sp. E-046 TaxID=2836576 RepID=UPI001FBB15E6|nr:gamma-glutamylcyclotransferase [Methylobacterium sp. E-046]MCJ2097310.1 gamma-glutamylcyclotransferase [Methylobacterium sp. E-046]